MHRAEAERADSDTLDPVRVEGVLDGRRLVPLSEPTRPDEQHVGLGQPAKREPERARRGRIEPLEVVDRDDDVLFGEQPKRVANSNTKSPRIHRRPGCILEEQRDLERPTLRRRQCGQDVCKHLVEQVAQAGVGESALGLGRPRGEHAQPPPARGFDGGGPERRFPDPGLALQRDCDRSLGDAPVEHGVQKTEVFVPADDFDCHVPPLGHRVTGDRESQLRLERPGCVLLACNSPATP